MCRILYPQPPYPTMGSVARGRSRGLSAGRADVKQLRELKL